MKMTHRSMAAQSRIPRSSLVSLSLLALACGPTTNVQNPSPEPTEVVPKDLVAPAMQEAAPPSLLPKAIEGDAMGVTIHRLKNGLTVYISTDRSTPSISSWISVRSGSRHDPADSTGLAHYLGTLVLDEQILSGGAGL
jgi:hypothetical protein